MTKANAAVEDIKNQSDSDHVLAKRLDLASLKSVRSFAEDINRTENRLDILLNNAGMCILIHAVEPCLWCISPWVR